MVPWVGLLSVIVTFPSDAVGGSAVRDCVSSSWCREWVYSLLLCLFFVVLLVGLQYVIVSLPHDAVGWCSVSDCVCSSWCRGWVAVCDCVSSS